MRELPEERSVFANYSGVGSLTIAGITPNATPGGCNKIRLSTIPTGRNGSGYELVLAVSPISTGDRPSSARGPFDLPPSQHGERDQPAGDAHRRAAGVKEHSVEAAQGSAGFTAEMGNRHDVLGVPRSRHGHARDGLGQQCVVNHYCGPTGL